MKTLTENMSSMPSRGGLALAAGAEVGAGAGAGVCAAGAVCPTATEHNTSAIVQNVDFNK